MRSLALALVLAGATAAAADEPVDLKVNQTDRGVTVTVGDLKGQPIPPTIVTAVSFLIKWGKNALETPDYDPATPVLIAGASVPAQALILLLPIHGLQVVSQTPQAAFVQLKECTLVPRTEPRQPVRCPATLQLTRPDPQAPWKVTGVSVP